MPLKSCDTQDVSWNSPCLRELWTVRSVYLQPCQFRLYEFSIPFYLVSITRLQIGGKLHVDLLGLCTHFTLEYIVLYSVSIQEVQISLIHLNVEQNICISLQHTYCSCVHIRGCKCSFTWLYSWQLANIIKSFIVCISSVRYSIPWHNVPYPFRCNATVLY